jgi:hypothetical protein
VCVIDDQWEYQGEVVKPKGGGRFIDMTIPARKKWIHMHEDKLQEEGHAIAQAVSRWLPTTVAQVHIRAEHVGFVVDKAALGQVFSEYFGFPC